MFTITRAVGHTIEEAIDNALEELKLPLEEVEIRVTEKPRLGHLAEVEVKKKEFVEETFRISKLMLCKCFTSKIAIEDVDTVICPKCGSRMIVTDYDKSTWLKMDNSKKNKILNKFYDRIIFEDTKELYRSFENANEKAVVLAEELCIYYEGLPSFINKETRIQLVLNKLCEIYNHYEFRDICELEKLAKLLYKYGKYNEAYRLFLFGMEKGSSLCEFYVGKCYGFGHCVDYNPTKARQYYERAASRGCTEAVNHLKDLEESHKKASQKKKNRDEANSIMIEKNRIIGNFYQKNWNCECVFNSQNREKEPCCNCSNRSLGKGNCKDSSNI